jgi:hypothetical protein
MAAGFIMVFLFYISWEKIMNKNTSKKNKNNIIISTYRFSFFVVALLAVSYFFSGIL